MKTGRMKCSHISEAKFSNIVRLFCEDLNAIQISNLAKIK
jgi:hypothetical protein